MFGFGDIYDVLIIAGCLGVQYFLATRNSFYWGAILPIAFLIWRGSVIFTTEGRILSHVLIMLLGLAFLIGQWNAGRKSLKEKQKLELEKMVTRDL
ncbi:hypothetical protein [Paraliobacillus sp. JSM ZJ581]|uniref:hypothetical protein n=1 Tax=Paraliobacillus sp. JSM ZJ581 TaxID=3342118 RepID=UPI0035A8A8FE